MAMRQERSLTRGSLERLVGHTPKDESERRAMRAAAWHELGIPILPPHEIRNEYDRALVIQVTERLYGKRITGPNATKDARYGKD